MKDKGKITFIQFLLLFWVMIYSATMRIIPRYAVKQANQAAWLTPIISLIVFFILIAITNSFVRKYPNQSFGDVFFDILSKPIGKVVIFLYIVWLTILLGLYVRYFDERLVSTIFPNSDRKIFLVVLLIVVGIILRSGIVVVARMNQIIFPVILIQFIIIAMLLASKADLKYTTPISYLDIWPVLKGSVGVAGIWVYYFFLFLCGDKILLEDYTKKRIAMIITLVFFTTISVIVILLGTFGSKTLLQIPLPLMMAVKNIALGGDFTGLDSLFLSVWILGDFITISLFSYIILRLFKQLFGLKDPMPILSILLIFIYIFSMFLANEIFELQYFSEKIAIPLNVIMGLCLPILIVFIGKLRKKL